ncbi:MAG: phosphoribosylformylglycinamidine cyclo-ligase [Planctomycetaceae bacterium]|jgi:phosphoribosylformylglycinamidine cyclo-ligase|nr:phosphoribosylformylglycinamidine cyclo-ligase [Planctomycetaceae bacterium]MDP7276384.1 phosphoribosylformylglycinamidine cyclo-ligase [Planctomycetaceae bacterium]
MAQLTYKDAGVDLEQYREAMQRLPGLLRRTHGPRVMDLPGGFAGLFRLNPGSRLLGRGYRDPVLVAGSDGVGTKVKVASMAGRFDTVGIDLVAMCVNDCLCLGAEPLFFLDYLALGADNPPLIASLVSGISDGCLQAEAALLGGETAIMPDLYANDDFDMAGFSVGVVERKRLIDGTAIRPGDVLLGLASSGLHSNGYSLARKAVFDSAGLGINDPVKSLGQTVGEVLLQPTRIYSRPLRAVMRQYRIKTVIRGMAHITGGGLEENLERILPEGCRAVVKEGTWSVPGVFDWIQSLGGIEHDEMFRVFNMGIGFVLVVNPYYVESIQRRLVESRIESWVIGHVEPGTRGVERKTV